MSLYRELRAEPVIQTIRKLEHRIGERFPGSGLSGVAREVLEVAMASTKTVRAISRPISALRVGVWILVALILAAFGGILVNLRPGSEELVNLAFFLQVMEAGLNDLILIGAAVAFLVTVEVRVKRRRALGALHELRSLAHVIDMHQLAKDPERFALAGTDTPSSPTRQLTPFQLSRYLDYCSELLSILSKIAALYAQSFDDSVALAAVDEIEGLTSGLSRKIWQKMVILNALGVAVEVPPERSPES
jgi:hypothetical protein